MKQYLELLRDILENGDDREGRTAVGYRSVFGRQLRYDLGKGFPLVTTRRVPYKGVWKELLWMIRGKTNVKYLQQMDCGIWDQWADEDGYLGPIYPQQWRNADASIIQADPDRNRAMYADNGIDQLGNVIKTLVENPTDRRMIVCSWQVRDLKYMRLPPCHMFFQFFVRKRTYLDCLVFIRSSDVPVGLVFNTAMYATLVHMLAQIVGLHPGELIIALGDAHIYFDQIDLVRKQIEREPTPLPALFIEKDRESLDDFMLDDFSLVAYTPRDPIKYPVAA